MQKNQHKNVIVRKLAQLDKRIAIFLPVSTPMIIWYFVFISSLIIDYFMAIYFICFLSQHTKYLQKKAFLPFLSIILGCDIIISLNTSYIQSGRIVTNKRISRIKYVKSKHFWLDLIAFVVKLYQVFNPNYFASLSLVAFIKYGKIKNFDLLIRKYVIRSPNVSLFYHVIKHMVLLVMVCHFIGCFFFYLDINLIQMDWYPNQMLWVHNSYAYLNIIDLPPHFQYCYSFYYAVVTLSGVAYGDLTPLNPTQVLYTLACLIIPLIIYAYIFSVISSAIKQRQLKIMQVKKYRKIARNYFIESGIDQFSAPKFVNYLSHVYEKKLNIDNNFLDQVAPSIKDSYMRQEIQNSFDFSLFQPMVSSNARISDIKQIVKCVSSQQVYPAKQLINCQKNKKPKLLFLVIGEVCQYIYLKEKKFSKFIQKGNFFYQYFFFTSIPNTHSNHMFQTTKFTICQTINLQLFLQAAKKNLRIFQTYHKYRNQLIFNNKISQIKLKCFFCQQQNHIVDNCEKLRLGVDVIECSSKYNQRAPKFERKKRQNAKNYDSLRSVSFFSKLIDSFTNMNPKILKQQKSVQTQKIYTQQTKQAILKLQNIDKVENWIVFEPQYTLE